VEPFDLRALEPAGRRHSYVSARRRHLRGMNGRRLVHGNDAKGLQSLGTLQNLAENPSTLIGGLETVAAQTSHVQKYVWHSVVRDDESEALGDIEPLNDTAQFNEIGRRFIDEFSDRSLAEIGPRHFRFDPVRRHAAKRRHFAGAS